MLLDLIIVALGILSSIFLGRSAYPGEMIRFYGMEICEFLLISLVIYGILFKIFGINKSLWSYLGVAEIFNILYVGNNWRSFCKYIIPIYVTRYIF